MNVQSLKLRTDLEFHKRANEDGVEWLIFDPVLNRYHLMGELQCFLLKQMDGRHTVEQIGAAGSKYADTEIPSSALDDFVAQSRGLYLLETASEEQLDPVLGAKVTKKVMKRLDAAGFRLRTRARAHTPERRVKHDVAGLFEQAAARLQQGDPIHCARFLNRVLELAPDNTRASYLLGQVQRATLEVRRPTQPFFYFRVAFGNPDRVLAALARRLGFLFNGWVYLALVLAFLFGASLVAANYGMLMADVRQLPRIALRWPWVVPVSYLLLLIQFIGHEACHGIACRKFGGRVPEMGFLFMFGVPGAFCDVSAAYTFTTKGRRIAVALAGSAFNFAVYLPAVLVFLYTPRDSPVHFLSLVLIYESWLAGIAFLIPFFKDDGYFAVSEALGIPNLLDEAGEYWRARARQLFLGWPPPELPARNARIAAAYGLLNFVATVAMASFFYVGVVAPFMIGHLKGPGVLLGALPVLILLLGWVMSAVTFVRANWVEVKASRRGRRWLVAAAVLFAGAWVVPVPQTVTAGAAVRGEKTVLIHAPRSGLIEKLAVREGREVVEGELLAVLDSAAQNAALATAESRLVGANADLQARLRPAQAEKVRLLKSSLATATTRESYANRGAATDRALVRTGLLDQSTASKGQLAANEAATEAGDVRAQLRELTAVATPSEVTALQAQIRAAEAERSVFAREIATSQVLSPVSGRVIWVSPKFNAAGTQVAQGDEMMRIAPPGPMLAELRVALEDIDLVAQGQEVWVKLDGSLRPPLKARVLGIASAVTGEKGFEYLVVTTDPIELGQVPEGARAQTRVWTGTTTLAFWALRQVRYLIGYQWWALW